MRRVEDSIRAVRKGPMLSCALLPGELTVCAVFDRSIYVRSAGGDIICLCGEELPMGPFTLMCESWPLPVSAQSGDMWILTDGAIALSQTTRIVLDTVVAWEPPRIPIWNATTCERALAKLREAGERCFPVRDGLAVLLPEALGMTRLRIHEVDGFYPLHCGGDEARETPPLPEIGDKIGGFAVQNLAKAGREGLRALDEWLCTPPGQVFPTARQRMPENLLGLGPGLTPSGDDVLGGVLLALHRLGFAKRASLLGERLLGVARERTNQISYAYLRAATAGYGSSVLHSAVAAVCADSPALYETLQGLNSLGHSSGWDAFLGIVCVCRRVRLLMEQQLSGRRRYTLPPP